jgi:hypothetical protein
MASSSIRVREGAFAYAKDAPLPQPQKQHEAEQVHQSVPVHGKRAEVDGDGVELRVNEHGERVKLG